LIGIPISSTCFGQFFAHPQERKTVSYIMWYNDAQLPSRGLERGNTICSLWKLLLNCFEQ